MTPHSADILTEEEFNTKRNIRVGIQKTIAILIPVIAACVFIYLGVDSEIFFRKYRDSFTIEKSNVTVAATDDSPFITSYSAYDSELYGKFQESYPNGHINSYEVTFSDEPAGCFSAFVTQDEINATYITHFDMPVLEDAFVTGDYSGKYELPDIIYGTSLGKNTITLTSSKNYLGIYTKCHSYTLDYKLPTVPASKYYLGGNIWFLFASGVFIFSLLGWYVYSEAKYKKYKGYSSYERYFKANMGAEYSDSNDNSNGDSNGNSTDSSEDVERGVINLNSDVELSTFTIHNTNNDLKTSLPKRPIDEKLSEVIDDLVGRCEDQIDLAQSEFRNTDVELGVDLSHLSNETKDNIIRHYILNDALTNYQ